MSAAMTERVTVAMCRELGAEARSGVLLWLTNASELVTPATRRDVAAAIMRATVWEQAGLLGLVTCTRCGDRGCDWCRRRLLGSSL